jgi:hypothetical protein
MGKLGVKETKLTSNKIIFITTDKDENICKGVYWNDINVPG